MGSLSDAQWREGGSSSLPGALLGWVLLCWAGHGYTEAPVCERHLVLQERPARGALLLVL